MTYVHSGAGALDYAPCRYGASRLLFRGPARHVTGEFCAVIGGSETYGKYVPRPFPALLEERLGLPVMNLGCVNAGPDAFLSDPALLDLVARAAVVVVQVTGAQNLSNRHYSVHPRRNDRFLSASPLLRSIYREVDFTEFAFTRHLLRALQAAGPERFALIAADLRAAWVQRMDLLLQRLPPSRVLLWLADHPPGAAGGEADLTRDPLLVDAAMIAALRPHVSAYVEILGSAQARAEGTRGMAFGPLEAPAARALPGPAVHAEVADALAPVIGALV